jgi:hypothetical protein
VSRQRADGRAVAPVLVLLGPAATGKSTLGQLVAGLLGVAFVDLDAVADDYYPEVGWSVDRLVERIAVVGRVAAEREWEPARAHAVERAVAEHPPARCSRSVQGTRRTWTRRAGTASVRRSRPCRTSSSSCPAPTASTP